MANKMLIDASHPEETRVVVLRGNKVQEFDFEAADKKPLRGNIYLAKVIRVEPSLQAAFVEYGGNRHGFLAFSEIHPDYYQIPVADRLALLEEERRAHAQDEEDEHHPGSQQQNRGRRSRRRHGESAEKRAAVARDVKVGPAPEEESASEHELSPDASAWSSQAEAGPEEWRGTEEARASEGEEAAGPGRIYHRFHRCDSADENAPCVGGHFDTLHAFHRRKRVFDRTEVRDVALSGGNPYPQSPLHLVNDNCLWGYHR